MHPAVTAAAQGYRVKQLKYNADEAPSVEPEVTCMVNLQIASGLTGATVVIIQPQTPLADPAPPLGLQIVWV